ncbi:hypothetical protein L208DRAFT_1268593 [Tricholoma matsutake]|nr:hypothetical protein L208DRAFT_1268593 [Tricholoma matsutake 945]
MQTHNSSPLQAPEASGKAQWSKADEITLIEYITKHKAEAGDGMKFKALFWSGAAKEMVSHSVLGGMKTSQGCSSKWDRLKKSYNVVATLKANTSGFSWSKTKGLNITINEACTWNEYIAVCMVGCVAPVFY